MSPGDAATRVNLESEQAPSNPMSTGSAMARIVRLAVDYREGMVQRGRRRGQRGPGGVRDVIAGRGGQTDGPVEARHIAAGYGHDVHRPAKCGDVRDGGGRA